ncbi:MAG TPA: response regulator [Acidimicrobiales bacterium]|nr:response regulator [Acidimicrobiales bacterium]
MSGGVLVVDDSEDFRLLVRMTLAGRDGLEVVGEAGDAASALRQAAGLSPGLVLLDARLPGASPLGLAAELRSAAPGALVVLAVGRPGSAPHGTPDRNLPVVSKGMAPDDLAGRLAALLAEAVTSPPIDTAAGSFPATTASAGAARRMVRDALTGWEAGEDVVETAILLTSEVVTNAVLHARSEVDLCLTRLADRVRVAVQDGDTGPIRRRRVRPEDQSGRGTDLVEALSDGWGVERNGSSKRVWFELRTDGGRP